MKQQSIIRDERFYAVENASYRIGYLILTFGIMALVFVRAILFKQSNWDFFALAWVSSLVVTLYQVRHKILPYTKKTLFGLVAVVILGAGVAGGAVYLLWNYLIK